MAAWWPGLLWCPVPMALLVWAPDDAWAMVLRPEGEAALRAIGGTLAAGARPDGYGVLAVGGGIARRVAPASRGGSRFVHVAGHDRRLAPCGH